MGFKAHFFPYFLLEHKLRNYAFEKKPMILGIFSAPEKPPYEFSIYPKSALC